MDEIDLLIEDIIEDRVSVDALSDAELDDVIDRFYDIAEEMQDDPDEHKQELANRIMQILHDAAEARSIASDMSCFEDAITEAETRGSIYIELDTYNLH